MKKSHIIALIVIAVALAALLTSIYDASTYATFSMASEHPGKEYHVIGSVNLDKQFEYNPSVNANLFGFFMKDTLGTEIKVLYNNTKPQDFEKAEKIVVVGKMSGSDFHASQVLMKCPSKYNGNQQQQKELSGGKVNS